MFESDAQAFRFVKENLIPREVEREVLELAREKAGKESLTRQGLPAGRTLREVYDTYGVL